MRRTRVSLARRLERAREFHERPHAPSRTALGDFGIVRRGASSSRDVEVHPRPSAYELLEEDPCRQRAGTPARRDVAYVGDFGVEIAAVVGRQRQMPDTLAGPFGGIAHLPGPRIVVAHQ